MYNILLHGWFSIGPKIGCPNHLLTALFDKQMQATEIGMSKADKVKELNDAARQTFTGCRVMITRGVAALDCVDTVLTAVRCYTDFSVSNDPYHEHDFGSFAVAGERLFWKFDYYDPDMQMASLDPADDTITVRVLTIMLAEEY